MVRNMRAVLKKASWGTRRSSEAFGVKNRLLRYEKGIRCMKPPFPARKAFSEELGAQNSLLWYAKRFLRHSATKKGSWGTRCVSKGAQNITCYIERIFKGPQNSRLHRLWTASCPPDAFSEACRAKSSTCRTGRIFSARNGPALFVRSGPFHHFLRPANAELVSGGPFPCSFDGTRYQKRPRSEVSRHKEEADPFWSTSSRKVILIYRRHGRHTVNFVSSFVEKREMLTLTSSLSGER